MLKQRIITALVLLPILLVALFLTNPIYWQLLMVLVALLGLKEWLGFCQFNTVVSRAMAYVLMLGFAALLYADYMPVAVIVLASIILWLGLLLVTFTDKPAFLMQPRLKLIIGIWLLVTNCWFLIKLKQLPSGYIWILLFLLIIWCADIGAYFIGRRFGKNKLAPNVSPGKTIEGVGGGLVLVLFVLVPVLMYLFEMSQVAILLPAIILTALMSVGGDLYESKLKRQAGLKDSSQILPGHGGILDRIDSVLAGLPCFMIGLLLLPVW